MCAFVLSHRTAGNTIPKEIRQQPENLEKLYTETLEKTSMAYNSNCLKEYKLQRRLEDLRKDPLNNADAILQTETEINKLHASKLDQKVEINSTQEELSRQLKVAVAKDAQNAFRPFERWISDVYDKPSLLKRTDVTDKQYSVQIASFMVAACMFRSILNREPLLGVVANSTDEELACVTTLIYNLARTTLEENTVLSRIQFLRLVCKTEGLDWFAYVLDRFCFTYRELENYKYDQQIVNALWNMTWNIRFRRDYQKSYAKKRPGIMQYFFELSKVTALFPNITVEEVFETLKQANPEVFGQNYWDFVTKYTPHAPIHWLPDAVRLDHKLKNENALSSFLIANPHIDLSEKDSERKTALHWAAVADNQDITRQLLTTQRVDVNARDNDGATPLHLAAGYGEEGDVVAVLLNAPQTDINARDKEGRTPLHRAIAYNRTAIVRQLLSKKDIDINAVDKKDETPLYLVIRSQRVYGYKSQEILKQLLQKDKLDVSCGKNALFLAIRTHNEDAVSLLLESRKFDVNAKNQKGESPLKVALNTLQDENSTYDKTLGVIKTLLRQQDIQIDDEKVPYEGQNHSILHWAIRDEDSELIQLCIERSQTEGINAKDARKWTPLYRLISHENTNLIDLILQNPYVRANEKCGTEQRTALHKAVKEGKKVNVEKLLKKADIDVNATDKKGHPPLYYAIENENVDIILLLLNHKHIQVNPSFLSLAVEKGFEGITRILLSREEFKNNKNLIAGAIDKTADESIKQVLREALK